MEKMTRTIAGSMNTPEPHAELVQSLRWAANFVEQLTDKGLAVYDVVVTVGGDSEAVAVYHEPEDPE
jgi:tryptophan synthase beta subunit